MQLLTSKVRKSCLFFCLIIGVLPIMILAQYCAVKDRLVDLRNRKIGSIWEKLKRESLVDSCSFCIYSIHSPFENSALILRGKIPPLGSV